MPTKLHSHCVCERNSKRKSQSRRPYYPVASRGREESLLVIDEEEVGLALVEGGSEVVWLRVHDAIGQTEGGGQPVHRDLLVVWDVVGLEGHLDLQHIGVGGQHLPGSVDLQEVCLPII